MAPAVITVSHIVDDLEFGRILSEYLNIPHLPVTDRNDVRQALIRNPNSPVFWNAETPSNYDSVYEVLQKLCDYRNLFAVTSKPLKNYPELAELPVFGHHLLRRYAEDGVEPYFRLVEAVLNPSSIEFRHFFSPETEIKKLVIGNAGHKFAVMDALEKYFERHEFVKRVSTSVIQAVDELILNAIMSAPAKSALHRNRPGRKLGASFELGPKETIEVQLALTSTYSGVCITDRFGTLTGKMILDSTFKHYHESQKSEEVSELESGLGFRAILENGLSLFFFVEYEKITRAMLFFPRGNNFKDFRMSCQFLGMLFQ